MNQPEELIGDALRKLEPMFREAISEIDKELKKSIFLGGKIIICRYELKECRHYLFVGFIKRYYKRMGWTNVEITLKEVYAFGATLCRNATRTQITIKFSYD